MDDVRRALRGLVRSPLYVVTAVLTLGLGIGATTAVFGLVRSVLLKPLPFAESQQLVTLMLTTSSGDSLLLSYPDFIDLEQRARQQEPAAVSGMAFVRADPATLRRNSGAETVVVAAVSSQFFPVLRAAPLIGRVLAPSDAEPGALPAAVLSYRMWTTMFGSDPKVIGESLTLSAGTFTIVGVLRPGQSFPSWTPDYQTDAYVPLAAEPALVHALETDRKKRADSRTIARLGSAVTGDQARIRLGAAYGQLAALYPEADSGLRVTVQPMRAAVVGDVGPSLRLVAIAVGLVLLLACANVANLTLARVANRARELAIRTALGAGAGRVVRALILESAIVVGAATIVGVLAAVAVTRSFRMESAIAVPRLDELRVDWSWIAAAIGAGVLAMAMCALAPAFMARRRDPITVLRSAGPGAAGVHARTRGLMVAGQIAIAMALLVGAGLLTRSLTALRTGSRGFDASHLVLWRILPPNWAATPDAALGLYRRVIQAARLPGVEQVSLVNHLAIGTSGIDTPVGVDGRDPRADTAGALYVTVAPQYFSTMRIPILQGRALTESDMSSAEVDAVVSRGTAAHYWPGMSALGHHIRVMAHGDTVDATVVGIAGDIVRTAAPNDPPERIVYLPITRPVWGAVWLVARTTAAPNRLLPSFRRALAAIDPNLPLTQLKTGHDALGQLTAQQTFTATVLGGFSGFALLLAAVGLYGLMSYVVSQRLPEIGIRICLGARPSAIRTLMLGYAAVLAGAGVAIGTVGAVYLARVMRGLLYGISPLDAPTFVVVALVLSGITLAACIIPLRQAARVNPISVLRQE